MPCPHSSAEGPCPQCLATGPGELAPSQDGEEATLASTSGPIRDVLAAGATVGRYVIKDLLGKGGMGVVYTAYDPQLDRPIALKLMKGTETAGLGESSGRARLFREAQAMAQLSHPNVVPVFDVGTHGNAVFVAMELVRGVTLDKWVKEKPREWQEILELFLQAGQGLLAAHQGGLVHRDFKPTNVIVGEDGRPRVADFGIARSTRAPDQPLKPGTNDSSRGGLSLATPLTVAGSMMGSPGYMAPEQYAGVATSPATDQFAFCVALYEALYGTRPFIGKTLNEMAHATTMGKVPPPPKGSVVPPWIHRIIERGLAPDPARRHGSMTALLTALAFDPARVVRRRLLIACGALAAVGLVLGVGWLQQKQSRVCRGAEQKLTGVWDSPLRARAQQAFEATGKSYASLSWAHTREAMDDYSRAWTAARTEACEATRIRGEQSERQMLLRLTCLDRRLDELAALGGAFASADSEVVDQSANAVSRLSPLSTCANLKSLEDRRQPPEEAREAVARIGQQLAQGRALVVAGKYALAREKVEPAVAQANTLKLAAQQGEAEATLGELERESTRFTAARDAFERSVRFAVAAGDDETAARSLASLVSLVGWRLERPAEGRTLAAIATGVLERMGGDARIEAQLDEGLGDAEWQAARRPESLAGYRRALAGLIALQGDESADVARLHSSVGWLLTELGQFTQAQDELERSRAIREKVLGADHPALASTWNELGNLAESLGDPDRALGCYQRALAIELLAQGDDSVGVARKSMTLAAVLAKLERGPEGMVHVARAEAILLHHPEAAPSNRIQLLRTKGLLQASMGFHAEAVRFAREGLTLAEVSAGKDHPTAANLVIDLARSLAVLKQLPESLEKFDRFLATQEKLSSSDDPEYVAALAESAGPLFGLKRGKEALARLERAVALMPMEKGNVLRAAFVHFELAQALWTTGGDRARARTLAAEAGKKSKGKDAEKIEAWLARHPG